MQQHEQIEGGSLRCKMKMQAKRHAKCKLLCTSQPTKQLQVADKLSYPLTGFQHHTGCLRGGQPVMELRTHQSMQGCGNGHEKLID